MGIGWPPFSWIGSERYGIVLGTAIDGDYGWYYFTFYEIHRGKVLHIKSQKEESSIHPSFLKCFIGKDALGE
ncbi:MAG TPA: hypothetical protein DDW50_22060 [Firmicutes bacterium]|nr:hypothetical protein [Bacillota bacterium]